MREIKFKAWHPHKKIMQTHDDGIEKLGLFFNSYQAIDIGDSFLMQYTGMKDKNGVEIYEGDIVCKYFRGGKQGAYRVVFKDGGFIGLSPECDMHGPYTTKLCNLGTAFSIGVIGNIHENPELLK